MSEPKKEKVLKIYVSEQEHNTIKSDIAKHGISISEYMLRLYHSKPLVVKPLAENLQKLNDLRGMANNLNQLARHYNVHGLTQVDERTKLSLDVLLSRINKVIDDSEN